MLWKQLSNEAKLTKSVPGFINLRSWMENSWVLTRWMFLTYLVSETIIIIIAIILYTSSESNLGITWMIKYVVYIC